MSVPGKMKGRGPGIERAAPTGAADGAGPRARRPGARAGSAAGRGLSVTHQPLGKRRRDRQGKKRLVIRFAPDRRGRRRHRRKTGFRRAVRTRRDRRVTACLLRPSSLDVMTGGAAGRRAFERACHGPSKTRCRHRMSASARGTPVEPCPTATERRPRHDDDSMSHRNRGLRPGRGGRAANVARPKRAAGCGRARRAGGGQ